mgnify:CR=1 FL=1
MKYSMPMAPLSQTYRTEYCSLYMKNLILILLVFTFAQCSSSKNNGSTSETNSTEQVNAINNAQTNNVNKSFHSFSILSLDESETLQMADYKGKKILIVNVASKCGYTPQYEGLQKLHEQQGEKLQIIGFPCNQFMGQEPGGKEEIASFCQKNYGVTFPLSTKIDVKGKDQHPIYSWLTSANQNGLEDYKVSWNFNKFLVDENGQLIGHFGSSVKPLSDELLKAINQ